MNAHVQIGETPEYAAPALRRSLSDIIAEYDEKAQSITAAIAAFKDAETSYD